MRERAIEAYLVARAKELGGEVRKIKWIGRRGAPDRLVWFADGREIWVELKASGTPPEPHQAREHERMRRMGRRVEVVDSFARVDEVLA